MAEQVQSILDQMVPSLRDFLDKGIFSGSEIRVIVNRRRESEYLLRRRAARKADFLRYIEAEKTLERLRELRTRQIYRRKRQNNGGQDTEERLANTSIVQHIHFLFQRTIRKWKSDVTIYIQHAEFAKQAKSSKMLGKIYAEALQIHPRHTGLWIEAASYEFFGDHETKGDDGDPNDTESVGGSILSARVLLQRGLRINPRSQELWLQAFALELHYIQKLRGRKEILLLSVKAGTNSDKSLTSIENSNNVQVPRLVYKNAIKSVPDDVKFRLKFMDLCQMFPQTESLDADIISTIESDFGDTPKAWISRAMYALESVSSGDTLTTSKQSNVGFLAAPTSKSSSDEYNSSDDDDDEKVDSVAIIKKRKRENEESSKSLVAVIQIIEEATNNIVTSEMFIESVDFMHFFIKKNSNTNNKDYSALGQKRDSASATLFLDHLFDKASVAGIQPPDLVLKHAEFLLHTGHAKRSYQLLQNSTRFDDACKKDVRIWLKLSQIASRIQSAYIGEDKQKDITGPMQTLRKALENIPLDDPGHLIVLQKIFFQILINGFSKEIIKSSELFTTFQKILMLSHRLQRIDKLEDRRNDHELMSVSSAIINSNIGKTSKENLFQDLDAFKVFFDSCICAEKTAMNNVEKEILRSVQPKGLKRVYDEIIRFFNDRGCVSSAQDYLRRKNEEQFV